MKFGDRKQMRSKYAPGVAQRAASVTQDDPSRTSEGGFQDGRQAYYTSNFGKSVGNLMQSRSTLKAPLKVNTPNTSKNSFTTTKSPANTVIKTKRKAGDSKMKKKMKKDVKKKWPPKKPLNDNDADDMKKKSKKKLTKKKK